jgi:hypothetical protein
MAGGSQGVQADVADGLSSFDKEFGARVQDLDARRAAVRLLDKEVLASASQAAVQAKAVADATRQLRSVQAEYLRKVDAVKLKADSLRAAEHQQQVSLAAKRSAAAKELSDLQAEMELARSVDQERSCKLKEQLAQVRLACEKAQKELHASIVQTKKALLAGNEQAEEQAGAAADQKESMLTQLREYAREIGKQRETQQRLVQENGEHKQQNEGQLKAIVSSHPNSHENLWREKLRVKSEQLAQLKHLMDVR